MAYRVPAVPADCRVVQRVPLPDRTKLWHAHAAASPVDRFRSAGRRLGRFHPIDDDRGLPVEVWYGARSEEAAIFESVFHDVPFSAGARVLPTSYVGRVVSTVTTTLDVSLADLTTPGLDSLRIRRDQLIEPGPRHYDRTARWAEYIRRCSDAPGLIWMARRYDRVGALVLFADRLPADFLDTSGSTPMPLDFGVGLDLLLELAEAADITVVLPDPNP